jgi:hypothetical protein
VCSSLVGLGLAVDNGRVVWPLAPMLRHPSPIDGDINLMPHGPMILPSPLEASSPLRA